MKEKSTDRIAAALMGDLLVRLAGREKVKMMLGTLDDAAADELIPELVQGIEKTIEWHYLKFLLRIREKQNIPSAEPEGQAQVNDSPRQSAVSPPPLPVEIPQVVPVTEKKRVAPKPELASEDPPVIRVRPEVPPEPPEAPPVPDLHEPAKPVATPKAVPPPREVAPPKVIAPPTVVPQEEPALPLAEEVSEPDIQEEAEEVTPHRAPHQKIEFDDNDVVYLHGVSVVPLDEDPDVGPFMLEEKGIEDRDFAFACDYEGMRIYLSKLRELSDTVNKGGTLLLSKPESLRLRRVHESILNDLRIHDVLLPFEFGTVARGKSVLMSKLDKHRADLQAALKEQLCTTWWNLSVYALDAHMAQLLGSEGAAHRREHSQGRGPASVHMSTKKLDVKLLDRILTREKKIAESVHAELAQVADRSDVDMMIGLGGGTSEDWKLILKASYDVPSGRLRAFNRAVTDLQYQHLQAELMFSLNGAQESFSFPKGK